MLEGGYDLDALTASTAAVLGVLAGLDGDAAERSDRRRSRRRRRDAVRDSGTWPASSEAARRRLATAAESRCVRQHVRRTAS